MHLLVLLSLSCPGGESECILSYHQYVKVRKDGSLRVREDIRVVASGFDIKRGIYRDFPTRYLGGKYEVGFRVIRVLRNGRPENYFTRSISGGVRLFIGRKDVRLRPGVHTYTIEYETDKQLGIFKDHDELYWNVTGNDWIFRMYEVRAVVELPKGVPKDKIRLKAFTGRYGSKGQDYRAWVDRSGRAHFKTTRPLDPKEGLTIVVGWPKGYVSVPARVKKLLESSCPGGEKRCIRSYVQKVKVRKDGSILVKEELEVVGNIYGGKEGEIRNFPLHTEGRFGVKRKVSLNVKNVLINGRPVKWYVDELKDWMYVLRVKNPPHNPGLHRLSFTYEIDGLITSENGKDVLNWEVADNVTVPIYALKVSFDLPGGVPKKKITVSAERDQNRAEFKKERGDGDVVLATTSPIPSLTDVNVSLSWPKGYISPPFAKRAGGFVRDFGGILSFWLVVLALALFYAVAWFFVGRDPKKGVIMPLFHPPKGLSPAAIRYLYRMDYDAECLTANIISAAVKGMVKIKKGDGRYKLQKLWKDYPTGLIQDERMVVQRLVDKDLGDYDSVNPVFRMLRKYLENNFGRLFRRNEGVLYIGLGVALIALLVLSFFAGMWGNLLSMGMALLFAAFFLGISVAIAFFATGLITSFLKVNEDFIFFSLTAILFVLSMAVFRYVPFGFVKALNFTFLNFILSFFAILLLFLWGRKYLPRFTERGMDLIRQIEGFRQFLLTAEKDRLEALFPEDSLPKIYERFLPYALALDVADTWADRFASYLEAANYRPEWYEGETVTFTDTVRLYSHISSSISSATEPPSSSSGSDSYIPTGGTMTYPESSPPGSRSGFDEDSGYSGGGGGGGGGGGW